VLEIGLQTNRARRSPSKTRIIPNVDTDEKYYGLKEGGRVVLGADEEWKIQIGRNTPTDGDDRVRRTSPSFSTSRG